MDAGDRDNEQAIFDLIIAGGGDDSLDRDADDGSQFLNESGVGMELESTDGGQTNNDGEENVGPLTKSGEVY
jgi:hypothetical protein